MQHDAHRSIGYTTDPQSLWPNSSLDTLLLISMAVACGVYVANVYYNQPILELLQQAFPHSGGFGRAVGFDF